MKPDVWWQPGAKGGLVSRAWAQLFVVALPRLAANEVDAATRYKVQAILPSQDVTITTRSFVHNGTLFGLALVDRFSEPRPETSTLTIAHLAVLPKSWPSDCVIAVRSPEGWELSVYEKSVLTASFPPVAANSPVVEKVRQQYGGRPWYAFDPAEFGGEAPSDCEPLPTLPKAQTWGVGWAQSPRRNTRMWVGLALVVVGLTFWIAAAVQTSQNLEREADRWKHWVATAQQRLSGKTSTAILSKDVQSRLGFDFPEVMTDLATAWPNGVTITRLEIHGAKISVTAHAKSALAAVSRLQTSHSLAGLKVTQIRPGKVNEDFDLEGDLVP